MLKLIIVVVAALSAVWIMREKRRRVIHPVTGGLHEEITLPHEAEFELYTNAFSHCSRKARLVFAELGLPYTHKPIDLIETGSYQTLSPEYLAINPAACVPALVHNGHPVYESDDIMAYAAQVAVKINGPDAPQLTPADETQRAEMQKWIDFGAIVGDDPLEDMPVSAGACIPPHSFPLFATMIKYIPVSNILEGFLFHHDKRRPAMFLAFKLLGAQRMAQIPMVYNFLKSARRYMPQHLQKLEDHLAANGGPWILGETYSLADISMTAILHRLDETGFLDHYVAQNGLTHIAAYYQRLKARPSWAAAIDGVPHDILAKGTADLHALLANDAQFRKDILGE